MKRIIFALMTQVGLWQTLKDIFIWLFDEGCYPEKHNAFLWLISLFQ